MNLNIIYGDKVSEAFRSDIMKDAVNIMLVSEECLSLYGIALRAKKHIDNLFAGQFETLNLITNNEYIIGFIKNYSMYKLQYKIYNSADMSKESSYDEYKAYQEDQINSILKLMK